MLINWDGFNVSDQYVQKENMKQLIIDIIGAMIIVSVGVTLLLAYFDVLTK